MQKETEKGQPQGQGQQGSGIGTIKLLKITLPNGVEQYAPLNAKTKSYHEKKKRLANADKSARYKIEAVEMDKDEALKMGFGVETIATTAKANPLEMMAEMMKQNQALMAQLIEAKVKGEKK